MTHYQAVTSNDRDCIGLQETAGAMQEENGELNGLTGLLNQTTNGQGMLPQYFRQVSDCNAQDSQHQPGRSLRICTELF